MDCMVSLLLISDQEEGMLEVPIWSPAGAPVASLYLWSTSVLIRTCSLCAVQSLSYSMQSPILVRFHSRQYGELVNYTIGRVIYFLCIRLWIHLSFILDLCVTKDVKHHGVKTQRAVHESCTHKRGKPLFGKLPGALPWSLGSRSSQSLDIEEWRSHFPVPTSKDSCEDEQNTQEASAMMLTTASTFSYLLSKH